MYSASPTLLTRYVRITIMCTLITLFFVISPIVIMYTAGYRFDTKTGSILETGVISIDIEPRDATAILNSVPILKQIPIRLTNRAPGKYSLLLKREGYHPFEHIITVESKQTTYLRDITLFKHSLPILTNTPANITDPNTTLYPHPVLNQYLVHTSTDGIHEIGLLTYTNELPEYTALIRTAAEAVVTLAWSPYAQVAIAQIRIRPSELHTYLIDIQNNQLSDSIITTELPLYHWSEQENQTLYIINTDTDTWSALTSGSITELVTTSSIPTHEAPNEWYIRTNDNTYVHPQTSSTLTFSTSIDTIVSIRDNTILAMRGNTLLRFQKQDAQVTLVESYEEATILVQDTNLLITTPWDIFSIDRNGTTKLLLRTSNRMSQVQLLASDRPELVITNSTGIDIFDPRYNMSTTLIQNTTVRDTVVEEENNRIYFFGTIGRQTGIFSLEI